MSEPASSNLPFETAQAILRPAAFKARELDPLLADAHAATGWVYSRERDWANAEKAFQQAIELNPSLTETYTNYSISTLQPLGKLDEALRILRVALRNDPLSLDVQREIGVVQLLVGRDEEAIDTSSGVRRGGAGLSLREHLPRAGADVRGQTGGGDNAAGRTRRSSSGLLQARRLDDRPGWRRPTS